MPVGTYDPLAAELPLRLYACSPVFGFCQQSRGQTDGSPACLALPSPVAGQGAPQLYIRHLCLCAPHGTALWKMPELQRGVDHRDRPPHCCLIFELYFVLHAASAEHSRLLATHSYVAEGQQPRIALSTTLNHFVPHVVPPPPTRGVPGPVPRRASAFTVVLLGRRLQGQCLLGRVVAWMLVILIAPVAGQGGAISFNQFAANGYYTGDVRTAAWNRRTSTDVSYVLTDGPWCCREHFTGSSRVQI